MRIDLRNFALGAVRKKLTVINREITAKYAKPFPKKLSTLLSFYRFNPRYVEISPTGEIQGGLANLVIANINLAFTRTITADRYGKRGRPPFDPATMSCLDLCYSLNEHPSITQFCQQLRDPVRGKDYRDWSGISNKIPSEDDFSNFIVHTGESKYREIFDIIFDALKGLGLFNHPLIATTDGLLFDSFAKYRGCTYFEKDSCSKIPFENLAASVRKRVLQLIHHPRGISLSKIYKVRTECPSTSFPKDTPRPMIDCLAFSFITYDPSIRDPTLKLLDIEDELKKHNLSLKYHSHIVGVSQNTYTIKCPKLPKDTDARVGVRPSKLFPGKIERVFGYNAMTTTLVNPILGLELPAGSITEPGNMYEGNFFPVLRKSITDRHPDLKIKLDVGDGHYDDTPNYPLVYSLESSPIFTYNSRGENHTPEALKARGYDMNGTPFAPCGILTRWRSFDPKRKASAFSCFKNCPSTADDCEHKTNQHGFSTKMSQIKHPRLILRYHRGSGIFGKLFAFRTASERTNSTAVDDLRILKKPRVWSLERAECLTQRGFLAVLLKKVFTFFAKITAAASIFHKQKTQDPKTHKLPELLFSPKVPKYLLYVLQLK
ncbi:MAG: Uncharacterized protein FD151_2068 [bacterium]|nr:MAG: Uncharacterized protein FD151_2068 [bacterium]